VVPGLDLDFDLRSGLVFRWCMLGYAMLLPIFYLLQPDLEDKALICLRYVLSIRSLRSMPTIEYCQVQAFLGCAVKFFFVPYCLNGLLWQCAGVNNGVIALLSPDLHGKLLTVITHSV